MILGVTGHRPDKLGGYEIVARRALFAFAYTELIQAPVPTKVITGMALGWDQAIAAACAMLNLPFIAAVPFPDQESRWPADAQKRYRNILDRATEVVYISSVAPIASVQANKMLQDRNRWIVDQSDKIKALWNGSAGGTCNCIAYAQKVGRPVENVWAEWIMTDADRELMG